MTECLFERYAVCSSYLAFALCPEVLSSEAFEYLKSY